MPRGASAATSGAASRAVTWSLMPVMRSSAIAKRMCTPWRRRPSSSATAGADSSSVAPRGSAVAANPSASSTAAARSSHMATTASGVGARHSGRIPCQAAFSASSASIPRRSARRPASSHATSRSRLRRRVVTPRQPLMFRPSRPTARAPRRAPPRVCHAAPMTDALDDLVRPLFPALARTVDGRPAAFLDGPGGSQMSAAAIDAMSGLLRAGTANDGGGFATSQETIELLARARRTAAVLTGSDAEEIAFGANMTTLNFLLAHAVARTLAPGDEIVVTELDHDANVAPWLCVGADHDLVVRNAPVTAQATLDVDALEALVGPRTRIVAFTLASNAVGTIIDARRIAGIAHAAGALAWADAVHLAPHRRPDRRSLGVDVLLCSPYKFFGPHLGLAAIRRDLAETWPADRVRPASEEPAGHRFETGTPSFEALAGFVAAVGYIAVLGGGEDLDAGLEGPYARIRRHEEALSRHVLDRLTAIDGLRLYGIADPSRCAEPTPTFCFTVDGATPRAVSEQLAARGIFTWDGNYYALALMRALGLQARGGAVRAGFVHYNALAEADRLADAVGTPTTAKRPRRDEAPA